MLGMRLHRIIKRDGSIEDLRLSAIEEKIYRLVMKFKLFADIPDQNGGFHSPGAFVNELCLKVTSKLQDIQVGATISTSMIDKITIDSAEEISYAYPDAATLAAVIKIDNWHYYMKKNGGLTLLGVIERAEANVDPTTGHKYNILSADYCNFVRSNYEKLSQIINYERDFEYPIAGCKSLEAQYLLKNSSKQIIETPQDMLMRVAIHTYRERGFDMASEQTMARIAEIYEFLSQRRITPATPILLRAGTNNPSMSSCFLGVIIDSIEDIGKRVCQAMEASKGGGGLAFRMDYLRAAGAYIKRTNGLSRGPMPFIKIFEAVAKYVNQGGHRPGSIAFYMSMWHLDIENFIESRSEFSKYEIRALDTFSGVIMPDLFTRRAAAKQKWTLMCPSIASDLVKLYGADFDRRYEELEAQYKNMPCCREVDAEYLYSLLNNNRIASGMPYLQDVDASVGMHNLLHDEVMVSNLCTEVILFTNEKKAGEAVCTLSTVGTNANLVYDPACDDMSWPVPRNRPIFKHEAKELPIIEHSHIAYLCANHPEVVAKLTASRYIVGKTGMKVDLLGLAYSAYLTSHFLNRIIDINEFPNPEARETCHRDRPIGIGQQGFADCLLMLGYSFNDAEAHDVNRRIAEIIYYFAMLASVDVARETAPVPSMEFTRLHKYKQLQPDIYDAYTNRQTPRAEYLDYAYLLAQCEQYGFANSVVTCIQPTESSAKLNGASEMCEPRKSMYYVTKTNNVETTVINHLAVRFMSAINMWNNDIMQHVMYNKGSLAAYTSVPDHIRALFTTISEYNQMKLLDMVAEREPFISMAQSTNLYLKEATVQELLILDMYTRKLKLRTRSYYVRIEAAASFRPSQESCLMCQ